MNGLGKNTVVKGEQPKAAQKKKQFLRLEILVRLSRAAPSWMRPSQVDIESVPFARPCLLFLSPLVITTIWDVLYCTGKERTSFVAHS